MLQRLKARVQGSSAYHFFQKYSADQAGNLAVLIAWTGLLSMFPLVLALLALLGLMLQDPQVMAQVEETIVRTFPAQASEEVRAVLRAAQTNPGALGIIGLGGLIFAGSALFGAMATAFNHVYRVPGRGLVGQRLMAIGMIILFSVLVVVSLIASGLASALLAAIQGALPVDIPGWGVLLSLAAWALSLLTAFLLFLAIYRIVPNAGQRLPEVWPGAALAAVLFFIISQFFPLYVRYFGAFDRYAIFGLFFLVMIWFYFLAQVLMLGCELNAFLHRPWLRQPVPHVDVADAVADTGEPERERQPPRQDLVKRLLYAGLTAMLSWAILSLAQLALRELENDSLRV